MGKRCGVEWKIEDRVVFDKCNNLHPSQMDFLYNQTESSTL